MGYTMGLEEALAVIRYLDGSLILATEQKRMQEIRVVAENVIRERAENAIRQYNETREPAED